MSIKLADHPYFTRSKGTTDSFPRKDSNKRKEVIRDNNEQVSLTGVVVDQPTIADQNELIMQLMQQIAEIRVEMQRRQDLPPPGFTTNAINGRPPLYFPFSNMDPAQNLPSTPAQNPSIVDLTTINPQYASASYHKSPPPQNNHSDIPPYPQNTHRKTTTPTQNQSQHPNHNTFNQTSHHHLNQNTNPQTYQQNYQTIQNAQSPSIAPPLPKRTTFQIVVPTENDLHGFEVDHYEEQEREWKAKKEA